MEARLPLSSLSCSNLPRSAALAVCILRFGHTLMELTYEEDQSEYASEFFHILSPLGIERYVHTHRVILSSSMPSHSHPTLTIHKSHVTPELLPAVFLHEQMHWRLTQSQKTPAILASLRRAFITRPDLDPVHLAVCHLEVRALSALLGTQAAQRIAAQAHRYRDEYRIVLSDSEVILACLDGLGAAKRGL